MDLCISTGSIWFRITVVAMIGLTLANLSYYLWIFTSRLRQRSQNLNKRKKNKNKKKKERPDCNENTQPLLLPLPPPNLDVMVPEKPHSQLKKDVKEVHVKAFRQFTYQSLVDATQNFHSDCCVSCDYLGVVYKGQMVDTNEVFAIRRLRLYPRASFQKFMDEVCLLSQANHPNLTKLIGYCDHPEYRFFVYEYVSGGLLHKRLHESEICLEWPLRMKIALGVAKALDYLQSRMKPAIQHSVLQTSNIWLDEECNPKVSAFGVARLYPSPKRIGSYYSAMPEYLLTKEITINADILGFGIFLLELITGKRGIFRDKPEDVAQDLLLWVEPYFKEKQILADIFDPKLDRKWHSEMYEVCNLAEMCIVKQPKNRPPMSVLVTKLNHLVS